MMSPSGEEKVKKTSSNDEGTEKGKLTIKYPRPTLKRKQTWRDGLHRARARRRKDNFAKRVKSTFRLKHRKTIDEVIDAKTAFVIDALRRVDGDNTIKSDITFRRKLEKKINQFYRWLFGADVHRRFDRLPRFVLLPFCPFDIIWSNFLIAMVVYNLFAAGVEWTFDQPTKSLLQNIFDVIIEILFLVDLVIQSRRAIHRDLKNGDTEYVWNTNTVRQYVRSSYFMFDLVASFPCDIIALLASAAATTESAKINLQSIFNFLSLLKFLRAARLYRWNRDFPQKTVNVSTVIRLAVFLLCVCHLWACTWYLLVKKNDGPGELSWLKDKGGVSWSDHWFTKYISSLYTVFAMMLGENVEPLVVTQYMFAFVVLMMGSFFISWLMGAITVMVQNSDVGYKRFSHKLAVVNGMMQTADLPKPLQKKIYDFYEYTWTNYRGKNIYESFVGSNVDIPLPKDLYTEVAMHLHQDVICGCVLFQHCTEEQIKAIVDVLRVEVVGPGDLIVQRGDPADELFVIAHGIASVFSETGMLEWRLGAGSVIGEIAMVLNKRRTKSVKAMTFCDLKCLHHEDYDAVMSAFPDIKASIVALAREHLEMNVPVTSTDGPRKEEESHVFEELEAKSLIAAEDEYNHNKSILSNTSGHAKEDEMSSRTFSREIESIVREEVKLQFAAMLKRLATSS
jgi:CRP-like cAMP-binding protein